MRQLFLLLFTLPTLAISAQNCDGVQACIVASNNNNGSYLFENCSTPIANSQFVWNFGDGTSENGVVVDHLYTQPGTYIVCLTMYWQNCVDSTCTTIIVEGTNPCDDLSADFYYSGADQGVNFGHPNVNVNWTYFWNFGDGTTGFGPSPYHTYPSPGTYETCLTVWTWDPVNQDSCFADHCEMIMIDGGPCDFLQACYVPTQTGATSVFFNNCTPNEQGTVFTWLFGDGTTSNDIAPTHTYANAGNYEVCLVAEWQNCFDSTCTYITVGQGNPCEDLNAGFGATTTPNGTFFSNGTTGTGFQSTWHWTFGDGGVSDNPQPIHTYNEPGIYYTCLTVISLYQYEGQVVTCVDSICIDVIIEGPGACEDVEACILVNDYGSGMFLFENCSTPIANSQFTWNFGDGATDNGMIADHTYSQPGTYTVCLTMYWQNCVDSTCTTIVVEGVNPCEELSADFYYSGGVQGVNFGHPSVNLEWTYFWNFGDGTTGFGPSPYHTYPGPGTYETCLTVWTWDPVNQDSCFADHCEMIIVSGSGDPCADLNAEFVSTTTPNGTFFSNATTGVGFVSTWHWDFGDGGTSNGEQPDHQFAPGTYTVCLTAISLFEQQGGGSITCTDSTCQTLVIQGNDPCDFLQACFEPTQISSNSLYFTNCTPTELGTVFTWLFGDGTTSNDIAPTHTYANQGSYEVCLVAQWQNCFDSTCTYITVGQGNPCNDFVVSLAWNEGGNATYFFNASSNRPNTSFTWYFGDDTQATGAAAQHVFNDPGEYEVCVLGALYDPISGDSCLVEDCIVINVGTTMGCDSFTTWFDVVYGNAAVFFEAQTSQSVNGYFWDFGDGTEGYNSAELHYYEPPGPYTVCLSTYYWNPNTQDSCWSTYCQVVDPLGPNGITDLNAEDHFTIYPQPATDFITIDGATPMTEAIVELFSMDGRLEHQERITALPHQLDVSQLTPAVHLMRIQMDGVRYNYRIVIQ